MHYQQADFKKFKMTCQPAVLNGLQNITSWILLGEWNFDHFSTLWNLYNSAPDKKVYKFTPIKFMGSIGVPNFILSSKGKDMKLQYNCFVDFASQIFVNIVFI